MTRLPKEGEPLYQTVHWLKGVKRKAIDQEFDRIIPIIADEGYGKSTLMIWLSVHWRLIKDEPIDKDEIVSRMVWTRNGYKKAITEYPKKSLIPVPDAARILYRKDAMVGDQKDIEKDLLQSRIREHLVFLGFQSWDIIPGFLQKRRAKNVLRITSRGKIKGYGRDAIDEKFQEGEWPEPDMEDTFPALDGTEIWDKYQELDEQKKMELMSMNDGGDEEEDHLSLREIAEKIADENPEDYVSSHAQNGRKYIDADLIELDWDISGRDAKKVKKLIEKKIDIEEIEAAVA